MYICLIKIFFKKIMSIPKKDIHLRPKIRRELRTFKIEIETSEKGECFHLVFHIKSEKEWTKLKCI
jgi:hypothetical protein